MIRNSAFLLIFLLAIAVAANAEKSSSPANKPNPQSVKVEKNETQKPQPKNKTKEDKTPDKKQEQKALPKLTETDFYKKSDYILKTYVDKDGKVDYIRLRRKRIELYEATSALKELPAALHISWSDNEKKAFWLNAHNILTLKLIVDNYPIKSNWLASINYPRNSIKQIPGAREKTLFRVMGFQYTLKEAEEVLLEKFDDVRICFGLCYGTVSGGILRNEVYSPENIDKQLDEQTNKYLAKPENFKFNNKTVYLPTIFKMKNFKEAFVNSEYSKTKKFREKDNNIHIKACLNFILLHIPQEDGKSLQSSDLNVDYNLYNWQLNEQSYK